MKWSVKTSVMAVLVAAAWPLFAAQTYPTKPINMVVPSAPAGSTDIVARLIGEQLAKDLGQPIVVENRPGASGNIGTEAVARAKPDGYTLLMQYSGYHVGNPALFPQARWKPKDFAPVALVMRAPHVVAVSGKIPAKNLSELIAFGKKDKRGLFYASSGNGSIQHIAGVMFGNQAHVPVTHVPYKGAGPVVTDLIGGQVDMFVTTPPSVIQQVKTGKIKALAYTGPKRHPSMPDVPTSAEAGLPGYNVESWFAVFAPAGTPPDIINKLSASIKKIVESQDYRRKIEDQGSFAAYMGPQALQKFVSEELATWAKVIKEGNITAE
ncbi:Bug family tripartite tricarboxylate transporter substrate binding protein [Cupriavidus consociatus]|uniref:Bug family tripartite tricarboxylate transporter substrate binding protein n=1 Tax=Cupriavidus consociatus TaxID=2821357 RepID=UPI001AE3C2AE|nr:MULTISPECIES: tripartite tricarboxylate transporter substrate binding protein [unclassified Cupriavidus]MBP0622410.1 tripartite tricarboxylate transporter substrate binding protein [Cupriavidus sp. LEh25]MDK2659097.1 tripartite tricarboxylate transporter substrate binding protein [Cupriavidus sp. LEh21]